MIAGNLTWDDSLPSTVASWTQNSGTAKVMTTYSGYSATFSLLTVTGNLTQPTAFNTANLRAFGLTGGGGGAAGGAGTVYLEAGVEPGAGTVRVANNNGSGAFDGVSFSVAGSTLEIVPPPWTGTLILLR